MHALNRKIPINSISQLILAKVVYTVVTLAYSDLNLGLVWYRSILIYNIFSNVTCSGHG